MWYKNVAGHKFLSFCHKSRVWQTDRRTDSFIVSIERVACNECSAVKSHELSGRPLPDPTPFSTPYENKTDECTPVRKMLATLVSLAKPIWDIYFFWISLVCVMRFLYVFLYYCVCSVMYFIVHAAFVRIKLMMMMILYVADAVLLHGTEIVWKNRRLSTGYAARCELYWRLTSDE